MNICWEYQSGRYREKSSKQIKLNASQCAETRQIPGSDLTICGERSAQLVKKIIRTHNLDFFAVQELYYPTKKEWMSIAVPEGYAFYDQCVPVNSGLICSSFIYSTDWVVMDHWWTLFRGGRLVYCTRFSRSGEQIDVINVHLGHGLSPQDIQAHLRYAYSRQGVIPQSRSSNDHGKYRSPPNMAIVMGDFNSVDKIEKINISPDITVHSVGHRTATCNNHPLDRIFSSEGGELISLSSITNNRSVDSDHSPLAAHIN